jgi:hypothetical protein
MKPFQSQIPLRHRARSQSFLQKTLRHFFQRYALDASFRDELASISALSSTRIDIVSCLYTID